MSNGEWEIEMGNEKLKMGNLLKREMGNGKLKMGNEKLKMGN